MPTPFLSFQAFEFTSGLTALAGAVIGGLLAALTSWMLERKREKAQHRAELRAVRRELELEAIDAAYHVIQSFHQFLAANHDGTDAEADEVQAEQFERWTQRFDALQELAVRVEVLASARMAHLLRDMSHVSLHFFSVSVEQVGNKAWQANIVMDRLREILQEMQDTARRDLGTGELDKGLKEPVPELRPEDPPLTDLDLSLGGPNDPNLEKADS